MSYFEFIDRFRVVSCALVKFIMWQFVHSTVIASCIPVYSTGLVTF